MVPLPLCLLWALLTWTLSCISSLCTCLVTTKLHLNLAALARPDPDLWIDILVSPQSCFVTMDLSGELPSWLNLVTISGPVLLTWLRYLNPPAEAGHGAARDSEQAQAKVGAFHSGVKTGEFLLAGSLQGEPKSGAATSGRGQRCPVGLLPSHCCQPKCGE